MNKLLLYSLAMPPPPHLLEQLFFISTYTGTLFKFSDLNLRLNSCVFLLSGGFKTFKLGYRYKILLLI